MHTFKNRAGLEFSITIDYIIAEKVVESTGFNLMDLIDPTKNAILKPLVFVKILSVLVEEQIAKLGLDQNRFISSLDGESIENAAEALEEALIDFSPKRIREELRVMKAKNIELRTAGLEKLNKLLEQYDPVKELDAAFSKLEVKL